MQATAYDVGAIWARIRRVLEQHAPDTAFTLAPPATETELNDLQTAIGLVLPEDFRQSLRVHNGQNDPTRCNSFIVEGLLANTKQIAETWRMLTEIDASFQQSQPDWRTHEHGEWWNPCWIPFTIGDGDCLCINLSPAAHAAGRFGEIVCHIHDNPHEPGIARSYGNWLEGIARGLENGEFTVDEYGHLWPNID